MTLSTSLTLWRVGGTSHAAGAGVVAGFAAMELQWTTHCAQMLLGGEHRTVDTAHRGRRSAKGAYRISWIRFKSLIQSLFASQKEKHKRKANPKTSLMKADERSQRCWVRDY